MLSKITEANKPDHLLGFSYGTPNTHTFFSIFFLLVDRQITTTIVNIMYHIDML